MGFSRPKKATDSGFNIEERDYASSQELEKISSPSASDVGKVWTATSEGEASFQVGGGGQTVFALDVSTVAGVTDTEKIQNALNVGGVVIINKKDAINTPWDITASIEIGSDTTLIINDCELLLADNVDDPIIRNSDFTLGNENIEIIGWGEARFDCNGDGQDRLLDNYRNIGVHFYKVNNLRMSNIRIKETAKWGLVPEACNHVKLNDIYFEQDGVVNQDGHHIIGPSDDIVCDGVFGTFGDDACVCNGRDNPYQGFGSGGDVTNIIFDNVVISGNGSSSRTGVLRVSGGGSTNKVDGVILNNAIGFNIYEGFIRFGGGEASDSTTLKNITANNCILVSSNPLQPASMMNMYQSGGDVTLNNCKVLSGNATQFFDNNSRNINNLQINNCSLTLNSGSFGQGLRFDGGVNTNIDINNFSVRALGASSFDAIKFLDCTSYAVNINNLSCRNIRFAVDVNPDVTVNGFRINNYSMRDCTDTLDLGVDNIAVNGHGKEQSNGELPSDDNWNVGDIIEFVDTGDGSGDGTYLKKVDGTFLQLV